MEIVTRELAPADADDVKKIISSKCSMYGTTIDPEYFIDTALDSTEYKKTLVVLVNGTLFGLVKQIWWKGLPVWTVGSLFMESAVNSTTVIRCGGSLLSYALDRAESYGRHEFYYVVRDFNSTRLNRSLENLPRLKNEYLIIDECNIAPYETPKFSSFAELVGPMLGKNSKPLIVRHAIRKPEFR